MSSVVSSVITVKDSKKKKQFYKKLKIELIVFEPVRFFLIRCGLVCMSALVVPCDSVCAGGLCAFSAAVGGWLFFFSSFCRVFLSPTPHLLPPSTEMLEFPNSLSLSRYHACRKLSCVTCSLVQMETGDMFLNFQLTRNWSPSQERSH